MTEENRIVTEVSLVDYADCTKIREEIRKAIDIHKVDITDLVNRGVKKFMELAELRELIAKIHDYIYPCDHQIAIGHNGKQVVFRVDTKRALRYVDEIMDDHFPDVVYDAKVVSKIRLL